MSKIMILCHLIIFFISQTAVSEEEILFKETFDQPLGKSWVWINENPSTHAIENGRLKIQLEPGGLMGGAVDAKNILVRPKPAEARIIEVSVEVEHEEQYEQAGLILYQDGNNYIKFVLEHVDGQNWLVLVKEVDAQAEVLYKGGPITDNSTTLRMEINEDEVRAYGLDDNELTKIQVTIFSKSMQDKVGLFTQSGRVNATRNAYFDNFIIKK